MIFIWGSKGYFDDLGESGESCICGNANAYMQPFFNSRQELITSLLVMQKYFELAKG